MASILADVVAGLILWVIIGQLTKCSQRPGRYRLWTRRIMGRWALGLLGVILLILSISSAAQWGVPRVINEPPEIHYIAVNPRIVETENQVSITVDATDPDDDPLLYIWEADLGSGLPPGPTPQFLVEWTAPSYPAKVNISVFVKDNRGGSTRKTVGISVVDPGSR